MSSAAITTHQYQQSPHTHNQYYMQQSPVVPNSPSSPTAPRRPSKRPSGNGAAPHTPTTPQQAQHHSPNTSSGSNMTTPRGQQLPAATHASPATTYAVSPALSSSNGPPVNPPPRTSSQARAQPAAGTPPESSLQARAQDDRPTSSRPSSSRAVQQAPTGYNSSSSRDRMGENPVSDAASAAQSRRRAKDSPRQPSGGTPKMKHAPGHSRSANAIGTTPSGTSLPREESTIISRLVVADPQEDIMREQARLAESRPRAAGTDITPTTGLALVPSDGVPDSSRSSGKSRQDHSGSKPRKETKFGDYFLGQTLGEGEFGKVKMGWKKDSNVQVAIKLIRRETLGTNPSRLPKIYREINILRELQHPNIVRLHEMVQTERHIGIILEYASGGELFDYILNHRYLKDDSARKLFAQLVSGVGYLHKTGIVHRDLKLENLLLDRNRNIIITDFGFANTFNPNDELSEEMEYNLTNRDFVKKLGLDKTDEKGHRRGDLMQTSCGSPCYAAPELVVSDSLYTGRKVDVWSCGVILYAMLAGYLPFDDDPANPEGDNINLLYKYIVSTPLTFPEYVTPHARDLLKRILVPDPRKRADLFEVARHSWLSQYAHVVGLITSSTTTSSDIANTTVTSEDPFEVPPLARSASVREPGKPQVPVSPVGGLQQKQGGLDQTDAEKSREAKRRTVQVEYVAPKSQTVRGEPPQPAAPAPAVPTGRTRAKAENQGPVEGPRPDAYPSGSSASKTQQRTAGPQPVPAGYPPPTRSARDATRAASDSTAFGNVPHTSATRPSTGGTLGGSARLPSRGNSYAAPVASVANTNATGRFTQPKGKQYIISAPMPHQDPLDPASIGRPSTQRLPSSYQQQHASSSEPSFPVRGHKRSNTVGGLSEKLFGRTGSIFGGRTSHDQDSKPQKSYPPTSMSNIMGSDGHPRKSTESSRRPSFSFSRKNSAGPDRERTSRRFSFLPPSFSMKSFGGGQKEQHPPPTSHSMEPRRASTAHQQPPRSRGQSRPRMAFGQGESRSPSQSTTNSAIQPVYDSGIDRHRDSPAQHVRAHPVPASAPAQQTHFPQQHQQPYGQSQPDPYYHAGPMSATATNASEQDIQHPNQPPYRPNYPQGFTSFDQYEQQQQQQQSQIQTERPNAMPKNRRFADAYEDGSVPKHAGTSGAARRVMDLFRRRGKARGGNDG